MATPAIDYNALAQQAGGVSAPPPIAPVPAAAAVDYDALAKQAGGVSARPLPSDYAAPGALANGAPGASPAAAAPVSAAAAPSMPGASPAPALPPGGDEGAAKVIKLARDSGVPDAETLDEIGQFRGDLLPRIKAAAAAGRSPGDVLNEFAGTPVEEPKSAVARFATSTGSALNSMLNPYPALKHYLVDVPEASADDVKNKLIKGDYKGALGSILNAAAPAGKGSFLSDAVAAQAHQFVQAYKDLSDTQQMPALSDRVMSAAGHTAAGLLPLVGPAAAAAGEKVGDQGAAGDWAGAAGTALGTVGGALAAEPLAKGAAKVLPAVEAGVTALPGALGSARDATADSLRSGAETNWNTAINPTKEVNKAIVRDQVAPGLSARGVRASSLQDLNDQANGFMDTNAAMIDKKFDDHAAAGTTISVKPILADLDKEIQDYSVAGEELNPAYVGKLKAFQQQVQNISDFHGGQVPLADLRKVRQAHDEIVAQSKGGFALPPDAQSAVNASKLYSNSIRARFAETDPSLATANREFNFWSNTDKVTAASLLRKTGQRRSLTAKFGSVVGAGIGGAVGHAVMGEMGTGAGAAAGGALGLKLGDFANSTAWNSLAAVTKMKLSRLLEDGNQAGAVALAKQNGIVPATPAAATSAARNVPPSGAPQNAGITSQVQAVPTALSPARGAAGGQNPAGQAGQPVAAAGSFAAAGADPRVGVRTSVTVPGKPGPGFAASYKLQELDAVNASHNGLTFGRNAEYKLTNDRNYANKENQGKVVNWSSPAEFDPKFHVTDNPDATNGPVVTDSKGNVIGGNGRAMIMQRVYNGNARGAAAYRSLLESKAAQFGIDPAAAAGMQKPLLTRVIDDAEFKGASAKQDAITDLNKTGTAALTPGERAIADSRRVSVATLDDVAARLDAKGANATLADVLDGKGGNEVMDKLIADGVISPQERAGLGDADKLNADGKARVARLIVGRFFKSPEQLDNAVPAVRAKIERIAAPLAQVEAKGEWSLTPHVEGALDLLDQAKKAGIKTSTISWRRTGYSARTSTPLKPSRSLRRWPRRSRPTWSTPRGNTRRTPLTQARARTRCWAMRRRLPNRLRKASAR
jgi:hypothetical protein